MTCPGCDKKLADGGPGVFECACGSKFWLPPLHWHPTPNKAGIKPPTWHRVEEPCASVNTHWRDE